MAMFALEGPVHAQHAEELLGVARKGRRAPINVLVTGNPSRFASLVSSPDASP